jgi:PAS domain S-box-containing protein
MSRHEVPLTGVARTFPDTEIIVSKTDTKGRLTYVNDVFSDVSGYTEAEVLGDPHSLVRHPDMPRCVFKLLWQTIEAGDEIFAYVNNRAKNGDHY